MDDVEVIREQLERSGMLDTDTLSKISSIERKLCLYHQLEKTLFNPELYLVYMHTTPDGRRYIGITSDTPGTRWNEGAGYEKQRRFNEAIRKYGWQNIKHEILEAGLTEIEAKK